MEWFGPSTSVNLHEVDASLGVSYTPALLKCIFRQLTNPQDRNSVELSCQRFCTASRATPWKLAATTKWFM
ncbi:unnamed protein product [Caenorhabditis auriculariae]|uniref:F-box domain-containing protein n=1 Tax=Caenorhabditis auriculariae TaxID=2777116 RepID=A0A8S1HEY3_9PELO|nr:unnamed protein product [Caenorhabditis auriculariae]